MNAKTVSALAGFVVLGLSPSFVDWQQTDGDRRKRAEIVGFYAVGLFLVWYGVLSSR